MSVAASQDTEAVRILRMGTFFWNVPMPTRAADGARLTSELVARLRADPRVEEVLDPDADDDTGFSFQQFYPSEVTDMTSILFGRDAGKALVCRSPIQFRVRLPIKNQPIHLGTKDVPSDTYAVAWNGITLIVIWEQKTSRITLSGGHIVIDVLSDAVSDLNGAALINQACSSNCSFKFMHPSMLLSDPDEELEAEDHVGVKLTPLSVTPPRDFELSTYASDGGDFEVLDSLIYTLMDTANDFAVMKMLARRILAIEESARTGLDYMITKQLRNSQVALLPARDRIRARWSNRYATRRIRHDLTALSLCLANLESLKRSWEEEKRTFEDMGSERNLLAFFETDSKSDGARVSSLDLTHLELAAQQIADTLNNTAMVSATLRGALAGGLAGGVLGAAATALGALGG